MQLIKHQVSTEICSLSVMKCLRNFQRSLQNANKIEEMNKYQPESLIAGNHSVFKIAGVAMSDPIVVDGSPCRLALLHDRVRRRHLGDESDAPLIDQLHHAMQLWKEEKRGDLVKYLRENDLLDHVPYWK